MNIHDNTEADPNKKETELHRWKWTPEKAYHWVFAFATLGYAMWRYATDKENDFLVENMRGAFRKSPYSLKRKQVTANWGWETTRYLMITAWKWYLLHPVLGRTIAHVAPSLVPVFYAIYSSLFVTFNFGWEVTLLFLGQHAAFYAAAALRSSTLAYVVGIVIHCQKYFLPFDPYDYMHDRYGQLAYRAAYVTFHWNLMRGLSFALDFIQAERHSHSGDRGRRWPPYRQSLGYMIYLPTVYLGPPQNYDDYIAQLTKTRPSCTPRVIAGAIARLLRSGAHFMLVELMGHFFYSSAMAEWPWMGERLDLFSLVGYALSLLFVFCARYQFTFGFAGALANAEGIEVPPRSPCIARMHRCSHFWSSAMAEWPWMGERLDLFSLVGYALSLLFVFYARYQFTFGFAGALANAEGIEVPPRSPCIARMHRCSHFWSYIYMPVVRGRRTPFRLVLGTAVAFFFTWVWHSMHKGDSIWCALSVLGIALEVVTVELRKWTPVKNFESRYLTSAESMRRAQTLLGSPHFLLTILACLFHLADTEVVLIICRRVLTDDLLVKNMEGAFRESPYGLKRMQVTADFGWETTRYHVVTAWKWYLLHPVLGRTVAHVAPSHMYTRYGLMAYSAAYGNFHWNFMRGLSFALDFIHAERQNPSGNSRRGWPPYWQSLGYMMYLPTAYLGPPQNYDDYVAQLNKTRSSCTPRLISGAIATLLRSGAHFVLVELMAHFFYSSAMSKWPWIGERLDLFSLAGYASSTILLFYARYRFIFGFAGALANAEGIEVPPPSPCVARIHRCSQLWRYFDRGMHLWIRSYIYVPVVRGKRTPLRLVLGTAVAFFVTWVWHSMRKGDSIWCALSVLGIALEVLTVELRKLTPVKNFESRYLTSAERMRRAQTLLEPFQSLLTIIACLFHLADTEAVIIICRRVLTGFPFPLVPILMALHSLCNISIDVAEWEAAAKAKRKQTASSAT
ncbi:hypothetical protein HPB50_018152 [Hyalomma asiaticum]|uniref:Uncharacterized protein n=1 Tax=Hyalomma asiaticum TaxID=266040 RepID=A0ACB7RXN1_HYAAI|nr:hypothetical protein HPB50_018152 [Hyalomma asiaticum]